MPYKTLPSSKDWAPGVWPFFVCAVSVVVGACVLCKCVVCRICVLGWRMDWDCISLLSSFLLYS